jgi:hypothetical protein
MLARPATIALVRLGNGFASRLIYGGIAARVVAGGALCRERFASSDDRAEAMLAPSLRHARIAMPAPALEHRLTATSRTRSASSAALRGLARAISALRMGAAARSTTVPSPTRQIACVKSYGDVLEEYEFHEEAKCADARGAPSGKQSVGLLQRRHMTIGTLHFIGKESNKLEQVEEGGVPDADDVYTEYPDPRRDDWETKILPT